jgi:hypothetical protein
LQLVTHLVWRGTHTGEVEEMQDQFAFLKQLGHAVQVAFSALIASSKLAVIVAKKPKTEWGAANRLVDRVATERHVIGAADGRLPGQRDVLAANSSSAGPVGART